MSATAVIEGSVRNSLHAPAPLPPSLIAGYVLAALKAAGYAVVKLPAPDDVGDYGPVWETGNRHTNLPIPEYGGPIGTVQFRPESGRIEVRDDYEHDYLPEAVETDALVLLAAARWARMEGGR